MNLLSRYKFVDECKDALDAILQLVDISGDIESFKKTFFDSVGALTLADMVESLPQNVQEEIKPVLESLDLIKITEKFTIHFTEDQMKSIYFKNFNLIVNKAFEEAKFDSIRLKIDEILAPFK